jgi:opacity protein-like surface antigen
LCIYRGQAQDAYAVTGGVEWRPNALWMLGARLEWRRLQDGKVNQTTPITPPSPSSNAPMALAGNDTWMSTLTAARKINRDWTFLGRNYLLDTDNRGHSGNRWEDKLQLGLAYRDTDTNRFNALARFEYWVQRDKSGSNTYLPPYGSDGAIGYPGDPVASQGFDKHIVSVQGEYHPSRPWWLNARTAAKWQRDHFDITDAFYSAYLISGRATYDFSKRWDLSGLASHMYSPQGKSTQRALGAELGYQLQDNLWLSAGYNWRGFSERDLTGGEYTNRGVYLRIRFKFDEDLFGARNPVSNPALAR